MEASLADFPTVRKPDYPVEVSLAEPEVLISRHRDGTEQRRLKGAGDKRIFRFTMGGSLPLTNAERTQFTNHYAAQSGQLLAFFWTHPEWNEVIKVRYAEPISVRHVGYNAYELEVRLKEVAA